jgi:hypothetical protein
MKKKYGYTIGYCVDDWALCRAEVVAADKKDAFNKVRKLDKRAKHLRVESCHDRKEQ